MEEQSKASGFASHPSSSFQNVVSEPAASGNLLETQILTVLLTYWIRNSGHGAQKNVFQQTLQVIPMCSIKSLVTIYLKKKKIALVAEMLHQK